MTKRFSEALITLIRFQKVCVFVVIDNASIDSRPCYRFDGFWTVHTKTFENDRIARCDVSLNSMRKLQTHAHVIFSVIVFILMGFDRPH